MAKRDWETIGFRLPDIQLKQFNQFIEQSEYDSKQEYFHQLVLEDIRDVTLDDPKEELEELRRQKNRLRSDIEDVNKELREMRDRIDELDAEEAELVRIVDEQEAAGAETYDEAVREVSDRVVREELVVNEKWDVIERLSEQWRKEPIDILRDVYTLEPRISSQQASPFRKQSVPDEWETRVGDSREEAIHLVRLYCEEHKHDENIVGKGIYSGDRYVSRVAEAHGINHEKLLREAISEMDEEYDEIVYS